MTETKTITVYDKIKDPLAFMMQLGDEIGTSQMFGCGSKAQGRVLAMAMMTEKVSPLAIMRSHHIIQGNLTMKAEHMLAEFQRIGGKHKVLQRTADVASVELRIDDEVLIETLTFEEAKLEPFLYEKDGKALKKNWKTPRARRQTLWARVISEGVKTLRPGIVSGTYTPEEVDGFTYAEDEPVEIEDIEFDVKPAADEPKTEIESESTDEVESVGGGSTPAQRKQIRELILKLELNDTQIDKILQKREVNAMMQLTANQAFKLITILGGKLSARIDGVETSAASIVASTAKATSEEPSQPLSEDDEKSYIREAFKLLDASEDAIEKALRKRGVTSVSDLTKEKAIELSGVLEKKLAARQSKVDDKTPEELSGMSDTPPEATEELVDGPCGQDLIDAIRGHMNGEPELIKSVKAHLVKHHMQKVADLSHRDAVLLLNCIEMKSMEAFFERVLTSVSGSDKDAPFDSSSTPKS